MIWKPKAHEPKYAIAPNQELLEIKGYDSDSSNYAKNPIVWVDRTGIFVKRFKSFLAVDIERIQVPPLSKPYAVRADNLVYV